MATLPRPTHLNVDAVKSRCNYIPCAKPRPRALPKFDSNGLMQDLEKLTQLGPYCAEVVFEGGGDAYQINAAFIDTVIKFFIDAPPSSLDNVVPKVTWHLRDARWPAGYFRGAKVVGVEPFGRDDAAHVFAEEFANCNDATVAFKVTLKRTFIPNQIRVFCVDFLEPKEPAGEAGVTGEEKLPAGEAGEVGEEKEPAGEAGEIGEKKDGEAKEGAKSPQAERVKEGGDENKEVDGVEEEVEGVGALPYRCCLI